MAMLVNAIPATLIIRFLCALNAIIHAKIARMGLQKINAHLAIQELKELLVRIHVLAMMASLMMEQMKLALIVTILGFIFKNLIHLLISETCDNSSSSDCITCSNSNNRELKNGNECPCKDGFY